MGFNSAFKGLNSSPLDGSVEPIGGPFEGKAYCSIQSEDEHKVPETEQLYPQQKSA